jgi:prolyl oligopeptidase
MGSNPASDSVLFRQFTREENAALATTWGPFGSLSRDGRWLLLGYWIDTKSTDVWLADFDQYRKTGRLDRVPVSEGVEGVASGTVIDGTLYLQTTKGASRGRVVAVDAARPGQEHWRDVVPERDDAVIESVSFGRGVMAVTYLKNASNVVEVFDLDGASRGVLAQPGIGSAGIATELDRTEAYLTFTSFNYPTSIFQVDLSTPAAPPDLWEQPAVPVNPADVEVEQVWYPSKDGTRISMFLVHRKGLTKDGQVPTQLHGYGGFNISQTPVFSATQFQWFESGGLFALPNLRGGGEYGDEWHAAGMLDRKQNVFDDFIAAAEWLFANGYTNPGRLAISGGSNGGLLTGAVLTQRPDLCRAAIVAVPLLDMLRYQHFLMARYWVPEYGSAEDAAQFPVLSAYSPYQKVRPGTRYPAVLLTAGEHDTRVHALHARKMTAALQAATTSDPSDQPVLLWVDREAGHGQGKPLNLRLRDVVDQRLFLMWQLGMS